jgi:hypothetical protein
LTGCSQSDDVGDGYLEFGAIDVKSAVSVESVTRATDEPLSVAIYDAKGAQKLAFKSDAVPSQIGLAAGSYKIVVNSSNASTTYANREMGAPKYYLEQNVTIVSGETKKVTLQVPMINIGVTFKLFDGYESWFKEAELIVNSKTLSPGETGYFDETALTATISMTNIDNEQNVKQYTFTGTPGTIYTISYTIND